MWWGCEVQADFGDRAWPNQSLAFTSGPDAKEGCNLSSADIPDPHEQPTQHIHYEKE